MAPDPLAHPESLIRRVYAYVAYRIGDGVEAEDVTSEAFERALRYRASFDPRRGGQTQTDGQRYATGDGAAPGDLEADAMQRLELAGALESLDARQRELIALRFGADLTARQIGGLLEMKTNADEVALHRALGTLRTALEEPAERPVPPTDLQWVSQPQR